MPWNVTVCVGSSCHIHGSRAILKRFAEILRAEGLEDQVHLLGSFCMERCGETMNWKFGDEPIASASLSEAEEAFRARLAVVKGERRDGGCPEVAQ